MSILAQRALLIATPISKKGLLGNRKDSNANATVQSIHGTQGDEAHAVTKAPINRKAKSVKAVDNAAGRLKNGIVCKYTTPYGSSLRILPAALQPEFAVEWDKGVQEYFDAVDNYILDFDYLSTVDAPRRLGSLYDASLYPAKDKLRSMFSAKVEYLPFPDSKNMIADLAQGVADDTRKAIEDKVTEALQAATADMVARAQDVTSKLVDGLSAYLPGREAKLTGQQKKVFRDSLVNNVTDTANLIEKLNIGENADIVNMVTQMRRLARHSAQALRDVPSFRNEIATEGKRFVSALEHMNNVDDEVSAMIDSVSDYAHVSGF